MKKNFITGLVLLLPIAVTVAVISFIVNLLTTPFLGLVTSALSHLSFFQHDFFFLSSNELLGYLSKLLILLTIFAFTIALGFFTRWFFIKALLRFGDFIVHKIPVINTVYKTTQDIIKTLFVTDKNSFQKVVMVPFPREDIYVLGLLVRESPKACSEASGKELISVLVPTTPNPTTGFLMMIEKDKLRYVDIKPEDAIKYIVSCGVIIPGEKHD